MLVWALEALSLSAMLLALWFTMRRSPTILYWSAGFAFHGAGLGAVSLRGRIPDFLSIQVANTSALFGMGLLLAGVLAFDKRQISFAIFVPAFIWTLGMLFPEVRSTLWARVALYQGAASIGYALIGLALMNGAELRVSTRTVLGMLQFMQAAIAQIAMLLVVIHQPATFQQMPYAMALAVTGAIGVVGSLLFGTRLLMMENEHKLKQLAATDPLTGALNRRGFEQAFNTMNAAMLPDRPLTALIHLDLDHFKRINDTHGHLVGDVVLTAFARTTDAVMAGRGIVGRLGGEEFACVLRVSSAAEAVEAGSRIRNALRHTPVKAANTELIVTTSAGIALAPCGEATLSTLLGGSDRALYAAKRAGRDRIGLDCENGAEVVSQQVEASIGDSIDRQIAALNHMGLMGRN